MNECACLQEYLQSPGSGADLDSLLAMMAPPREVPEDDSGDLKKVVLARCVRLAARGHLPPLAVLALLQRREASSYQFALMLPEGSAFVSVTPERLFSRRGTEVSSEAVAGASAAEPCRVRTVLHQIDGCLCADAIKPRVWLRRARAWQAVWFLATAR